MQTMIAARKYSLAELERLRELVGIIEKPIDPSRYGWDVNKSCRVTDIEEAVRTHMMNGTTVDELEAKLEENIGLWWFKCSGIQLVEKKRGRDVYGYDRVYTNCTRSIISTITEEEYQQRYIWSSRMTFPLERTCQCGAKMFQDSKVQTGTVIEIGDEKRECR